MTSNTSQNVAFRRSDTKATKSRNQAVLGKQPVRIEKPVDTRMSKNTRTYGPTGLYYISVDEYYIILFHPKQQFFTKIYNNSLSR